jgi:alkylation response protein AidB-like acyl-CoA dehydrogenase
VTTEFTPPVRDIVRAAASVGAPLSREEVDVVGAFATVAAQAIAPSDRAGDAFGARLEPDGSVVVAPEVERAWRAFADGGWGGATAPADVGGGGLGPVATAALQELFSSANLALSLMPTLTNSGIHLLTRWATPDQKERYLRPLVNGEWSATMCMTEPAAGSDVGALRTRARPGPDGLWLLDGEKIFITWGEHDLVDNILHLVLARTPDAPEGSRGISVFAVPKVLPDGTRNGIRCARLEHKLGIHSSPTCVMELDGALGELIGGECQGMSIMFTMMNAARLAIGIQGLAVAQRATEQAWAYAATREQFGALIEAHPDVRRMLLDLRASTRAMRLLIYATAAADGARADLLTPLAKAWPTDEGFRLASVALQVHGGAGFIEETGIAHRLRDVRISSIYEGTNGIQAVDLAMRKVRRDGGTTIGAMLDELDALVCPDDVAPVLARGLDAARVTTAWVIAQPDADVLAGATAYLELVATVVAGVLLAARATAADADADELADARFFAHERVTLAPALADRITSGAARLDLAGG